MALNAKLNVQAAAQSTSSSAQLAAAKKDQDAVATALKQAQDDRTLNAAQAIVEADAARSQAAQVLKSQTSPVVTVIVGALAAILSPLLMAWLVNRNARQKQADDYKRQDLVADRAAEAAQHLLDQQAQIGRGAARTAQVLTAKVEQIHTLVNSNLTASMQDQLDARRSYLVLLQAAVEAQATQHQTPTHEALGLIEATKSKVAELEAQLSDRLKQTNEAAQQLQVDLAKEGTPA